MMMYLKMYSGFCSVDEWLGDCGDAVEADLPSGFNGDVILYLFVFAAHQKQSEQQRDPKKYSLNLFLSNDSE